MKRFLNDEDEENKSSNERAIEKRAKLDTCDPNQPSKRIQRPQGAKSKFEARHDEIDMSFPGPWSDFEEKFKQVQYFMPSIFYFVVILTGQYSRQ